MSFVSCKWDNFLHHGQGRYKLIDTDFIEEGGYPLSPTYIGWEVIIDAYEKRNLNVALNLLRAMRWYCNSYNGAILAHIEMCKEKIPGFDKYEQEIEKYLVLV